MDDENIDEFETARSESVSLRYHKAFNSMVSLFYLRIHQEQILLQVSGI